MDISNLPTDNLYKFLAISGLIILFSSYAAPEYVLFQLEIRKSDVIANQQKLLIQGEAIELELEKLKINLKIGNTLSNSKANKDYDAENKTIEQLKSLQASHTALLNENKNVTEWRKMLRDQESQKAQLNIIEQKIKKYSLHAVFGRILGLLITLFGFSMWYYKTQRHIDSNLLTGQ